MKNFEKYIEDLIENGIIAVWREHTGGSRSWYFSKEHMVEDIKAWLLAESEE